MSYPSEDGIDHRLSLIGIGLCLGLFAYGAIILIGVRELVPILLTGDVSFFLPQSFYLLNRGVLENIWLNPIHSGVFNWHGFLQPSLVAFLSPGKSWAAVNTGLNTLAFLSYSIFVAAVLVFIRSWIWRLFGSVVVASAFLSYTGRPETTAALLALLMVIVNARSVSGPRAEILRSIINGGLIGSLISAHPSAAFLSALALGVYLVIHFGREESPVLKIVWHGLIVFVSGAIVFSAAVYILFDHGIGVWLHGIISQAANFSSRTDTYDFFRYYLFLRFFPLLLVTFGFVVLLGVGIYRKREIIRNKMILAVVVAGSAVILLVVYRQALLIPAAYYNYSFAIPAVVLIAAMIAQNESSRAIRLSGFGVLAVLFAGCAASQAVWLYQSYLSYPLVSERREALGRIIADFVREGRRVGADATALSAVSDVAIAEKLRIVVPFSDDEAAPKAADFDIFIRVQTQIGLKTPQTLAGFELVENRFQSFESAPISKPFNLSYAVYRSLAR